MGFLDRLSAKSRQLGGPLLVQRDQFGGPLTTAHRVRIATDLVELVGAIHTCEFREP